MQNNGQKIGYLYITAAPDRSWLRLGYRLHGQASTDNPESELDPSLSLAIPLGPKFFCGNDICLSMDGNQSDQEKQSSDEDIEEPYYISHDQIIGLLAKLKPVIDIGDVKPNREENVPEQEGWGILKNNHEIDTTTVVTNNYRVYDKILKSIPDLLDSTYCWGILKIPSETEHVYKILFKVDCLQSLSLDGDVLRSDSHMTGWHLTKVTNIFGYMSIYQIISVRVPIECEVWPYATEIRNILEGNLDEGKHEMLLANYLVWHYSSKN